MAGLISYRNLVDSSTAILTATGAVQPAFPLSLLKVRQLSPPTRIDRVSAQTFQLEIFIDRGATAPVASGGGVAGVIGINALTGSVQPTSMSVSSSATSSGYVTIGATTSFVDAGSPKLQQSIFCEITGDIRRYVRVNAQWFVGPGVSYGQVGRLWLGPAIVLGAGVDDYWELDYADQGMLVSAKGGQVFEAPTTRVRVLRCSASKLTSLHAFGLSNNGTASLGDVPNLQGMQMEVGLTGDLVLVPRSSSDLWNRRAAVYGHLDPSGRGSIRKAPGDYYSTSLVAYEER